MLRLTTFGGLLLQQDGRLHTGPASQRRRLALLAAVASSGRRGASRERLLSLLWPDSAPEAGRHSLYQALHAIRRSLGSDDVFVGTTTLQPAYLSPEQLAGEPPFGGASLASVLSRKLTQAAPRVRTHRDSVPPRLDAFIARCLARFPADRFQSALEAREALKTAI